MANDPALPDALECPKCGAQMRIQRYPENDAYRCEGCQGLWLPLMAHEQLEERAEQIANVTYTAPTETGETETISDAAIAAAASRPVGEVPRVGRNDPCPCGSGKKYKHCHGKLD